mgnify:CR=1 FL=1
MSQDILTADMPRFTFIIILIAYMAFTSINEAIIQINGIVNQKI